MFKTGQESLHGVSSFSARQRRDNTRGGIRAIVPPHFARSRANSARKIFSRLAGRGKQMGREIKEDDSWRYRGVEITPSADDDLDEAKRGLRDPGKESSRSVLQGEQPLQTQLLSPRFFSPFPSEQKLVPYAKRTER